MISQLRKLGIVGALLAAPILLGATLTLAPSLHAQQTARAKALGSKMM